MGQQSAVLYVTPVPNKWLGHSRENACKRQKLIDFNMLPFYEKGGFQYALNDG